MRTLGIMVVLVGVMMGCDEQKTPDKEHGKHEKKNVVVPVGGENTVKPVTDKTPVIKEAVKKAPVRSAETPPVVKSAVVKAYDKVTRYGAKSGWGWKQQDILARLSEIDKPEAYQPQAIHK